MSIKTAFFFFTLFLLMPIYCIAQEQGQSSVTKTQVLNELQKSKEKSIESGDMESAKQIYSEMEKIRKDDQYFNRLKKAKEEEANKRKSMLESQEKVKYMKQLSEMPGGQTRENSKKLMDKIYQEAVKSGDKERAQRIKSEMQEAERKEGLTRQMEKEKYMQQISEMPGGPTKENTLKFMDKMYKEAVKSGDKERAKGILEEMGNVKKQYDMSQDGQGMSQGMGGYPQNSNKGESSH